MTRKELLKEGWICFEESTDLDEEITDEDLNECVEEFYILSLKHKGIKNIHPKLKERYDKLKDRTKLLENIRDIFIIKDSYLTRRSYWEELNDFIIVQDLSGLSLVYDITTGEDFSFKFNRSIEFIKNKTVAKQLYSKNDEDYQERLNIGYMNKIILYKNITLYNKHNNLPISTSNFIVFYDTLGNIIYLDYKANKIYTRQNNYFIEDNEIKSSQIIFERNHQCSFDIKCFGRLKRVGLKLNTNLN